MACLRRRTGRGKRRAKNKIRRRILTNAVAVPPEIREEDCIEFWLAPVQRDLAWPPKSLASSMSRAGQAPAQPAENALS